MKATWLVRPRGLVPFPWMRADRSEPPSGSSGQGEVPCAGDGSMHNGPRRDDKSESKRELGLIEGEK